ncbi:hypothetical protein M9H77_21245 [Catharanthus roseus]|uniref:Uncharacterized protein n=1 Tax=Catharanthus roseus TaxID=4058 RepID=A0ACC0APJ2_CATRO|nr:hypothetical protein M9H77_21245 [Catharanthus roseus]
MEEVPAHVHPSPIVPDVLTRQHEHRSGVIWSGDRETFAIYSSVTLRTWIFIWTVVHGSFRGCMIDRGSLSHSTDLGVVTYTCIAASVDDRCSGGADPLAPLGVIWCTCFDCSQLPTHTLVPYSDQLDFMPSDQVRFKIFCIICK